MYTFILLVALVISQIIFPVSQLVDILTPLITLGITQLVIRFKPKLSGWVIVLVVVPVTGLIIGLVQQFLELSTLPILVTMLLSFVSIALKEIIKQLSQGNDQSKTASRNIIKK